jgi:hypothetical protein
VRRPPLELPRKHSFIITGCSVQRKLPGLIPDVLEGVPRWGGVRQ